VICNKLHTRTHHFNGHYADESWILVSQWIFLIHLFQTTTLESCYFQYH